MMDNKDMLELLAGVGDYVDHRVDAEVAKRIASVPAGERGEPGQRGEKGDPGPQGDAGFDLEAFCAELEREAESGA